jgi:PhoD-like phosphatase
MSLIGEYETHGAYVTSLVTGSAMIDLALSSYPDMSRRILVGAQKPDADAIVRHDLAGALQPGTRYYARLMADGKVFGRSLSFRTAAAAGVPSNTLVALVSCQRNAESAGTPLGWLRLTESQPDLLLHMGDYGYWGGHLSAREGYTAHVAKYVDQTTGLPAMQRVLESVSSLIQVSDHEVSANGGDTWNDPLTAHALRAYFRLMPFRSFDDATSRSRFLTRKIDENIRLIAPDFRSLDRSPGSWPDTDTKSAYGEHQFQLVRAALRAPEPLKIILSDPGATPADPPSDPGDPRYRDKWCNYQSAFQRMVDVIRHERTVDDQPIRVDMWSGDRHMLGYVSEANNPWGPFDVLTSSGIDQDALALEPGEQYDRVFGNKTGKGQTVKQHMEITLRDDKAGTISRLARGIDDLSGADVIYAEKSWSY